MSLIEQIISLIAPHVCVGCTTEGSLLCPGCAHTLAVVPSRCYRCNRACEGYRTCPTCRKQSTLFEVTPVTPYSGAAKELVRRLKFERAQAGADFMARLIANALSSNDALFITHVPTAQARVRVRGYDQAALIAKALARRTGGIYAPLLVRIGDVRQVGQGRAARQKQMKDVFLPTNQQFIKNKHILLIDDVLTTGSTCEAAAQTLKDAGAKRVSAAVFAVV